MNHWGWYWKHKRKHKAKMLCSWSRFHELDSFAMFRKPIMMELVRNSKDKISLIIPQYNLTAFLRDDNSLFVEFNQGSYLIPIEAKKPNFGGVYYFFHCPKCSQRMRKLYCLEGQYQCRKCANLGYASQRNRPSIRNLLNTGQIKDYLKNIGGSLNDKPPRMHKSTFQKARIKYIKYDELFFHQTDKEILSWRGSKIGLFIGDPYFPLDSNLADAMIEQI